MLCAVVCAVAGTDGVFRATTNLPALITEDLLTSFILKAAEDSICTQIVTTKHNILITSSSSRLRWLPPPSAAPYRRGCLTTRKQLRAHVSMLIIKVTLLRVCEVYLWCKNHADKIGINTQIKTRSVDARARGLQPDWLELPSRKYDSSRSFTTKRLINHNDCITLLTHN